MNTQRTVADWLDTNQPTPYGKASGVLSVEKMTAKITYIVPGLGDPDADAPADDDAAAAEDESKTPRELAGSIELVGLNADLAGMEWADINIQVG